MQINKVNKKGDKLTPELSSEQFNEFMELIGDFIEEPEDSISLKDDDNNKIIKDKKKK